MRNFFIACIVLGFPVQDIKAQDSAGMAEIFQRITTEMHSFKIDTSSVPEDRITAKIRELQSIKGVFNINEAISFKLSEEDKENKTPKETLNKLRQSMLHGEGKRWLENAVIHIYRKHFTYNELKKMVKFYKTSAGQKLADQFPFIMMKSLLAGQVVHDWIVKMNRES